MPPQTVRSRRARFAALAAVVGALLVLPSAAQADIATTAFDGAALTGEAAMFRAAAAAPPSGFQETVALSGLTNPMAVRFAPDGRIFVAEKSGVIKVFD